MNLTRLLQDIIERIFDGETVPVKKIYQTVVEDDLNSKAVPFTVTPDETNPERVLFRLIEQNY